MSVAANAGAAGHGVIPREAAATMGGRDVLQAIIDGRLPQATISRTLSFRLVEVGDGLAVFEGDPGEHLMNPMGSVHGGWALTLIDSATGCAAYSLLPPGVGYTTVETKANFARPILATAGVVRVEGRVLTQGRQIIVAEATAKGADGKIVAHGTSTLIVLGPSRS